MWICLFFLLVLVCQFLPCKISGCYLNCCISQMGWCFYSSEIYFIFCKASCLKHFFIIISADIPIFFYLVRNTFFLPFTFILSVCLYLGVVCLILIQSENLCLLIRVHNLCTFNTLTDILEFKPTLFFSSLQLFSFSPLSSFGSKWVFLLFHFSFLLSSYWLSHFPFIGCPRPKNYNIHPWLMKIQNKLVFFQLMNNVKDIGIP